MLLQRVFRAVFWQGMILAIGCWVVQQSAQSQTANRPNKPSACLPTFPYKDGWLGGDAAYSIALAPGKSLWLFGDSFVGQISAPTRGGSSFVRNAIALSTCDEHQRWQINYYWGGGGKPAPTAFFETNAKEYWYWPLDGFLYQNRLYVALAKLENNPQEKIFSFKTAGVVLAKVSNPSAPPNQWRMKYFKLTEGPDFYPGATVVVHQSHAYFFVVNEKERHTILIRVPLQKLDEPAANLQYFAKDKTWKHGLNGADALVVIETGHTEMSVRYHRRIKQWVAVTGGDFLSNKIMIRTAPELTGPWSQWHVIHEFPEMNPQSARYDPDTWCYAVKEHIEFATLDKLLVTYACNSFKFEKQVANMSIYRPQAVLLELPQK
jgi:uncharacterized protein DUF4185